MTVREKDGTLLTVLMAWLGAFYARKGRQADAGEWSGRQRLFDVSRDLAYTVATEPERIAAAERAAVVKALREAERRMFGTTDGDLIGGESDLPAGELRRLLWLPYGDGGEPPADAIENGAPL